MPPRGVQKCKSDLSKEPTTVAGAGPLPCELKGEHEWHQRMISPLGPVKWKDLPNGREFRTMTVETAARES